MLGETHRARQHCFSGNSKGGPGAAERGPKPRRIDADMDRRAGDRAMQHPPPTARTRRALGSQAHRTDLLALGGRGPPGRGGAAARELTSSAPRTAVIVRRDALLSRLAIARGRATLPRSSLGRFASYCERGASPGSPARISPSGSAAARSSTPKVFRLRLRELVEPRANPLPFLSEPED